jgi:MFS family permease
MSKKHPVQKNSRKTVSPRSQSGQKPGRTNVQASKPFDLWESTFVKYLPGIFYVSLFLTVILGIYLFDVKISSGGDDSDYILSAKKFMEGREFPSWHGSFYPIFLSLPYLVFGFNLIVFKITSFIFVAGHLIFLYLAFRHRIPSLLLSLILLCVAVNSSLLYFASQTYSEALYLFLQAFSFYLFFEILDLTDKSDFNPKTRVVLWLTFGLMMMLLSITRPVGYAMIIAVLFYLLVSQQFANALRSLLSFLVFYIPFSLYKWIVWGIAPGAGNGRMEEILYKNPYSKAAGIEDFSGMAVRFMQNCKLYLSKHLFKIIGWKDPQSTDTSVFITLLVIGLFLLVLVLAIRRKNKIMTALALYLGCAVCITFVTLQQSWDQTRLILIYVPFILILFSWGIFQLFPSSKLAAILTAGLLVIIFFTSLSDTSQKLKENQKVLAKNLRGNLYYGFTPDWQNFLKMSEWVGKNLPESTVVVSRKPSMSFVYSKGKEFYPMYRFPTEDADTMVARLTERIGPMIAIRQNDLYGKNISPVQTLITKPSMVAVVSQEDDVYTLHRSEASLPQMEFFLRQNQIPFITADSLLILLHRNNKSFYAISPDTLLNNLRINKVEYVIAANLRAIPSAKTERIVNTVQRYLYIIEIKFPGIFTLHHQVGDNNNEPALLYRINYAAYGFSPGKP